MGFDTLEQFRDRREIISTPFVAAFDYQVQLTAAELDIVCLSAWDYGDSGAMAKGHVDKYAFQLGVADQCDIDIQDIDDIRHVLCRWVPMFAFTGERGSYLSEVSKPGRGVFPATVWYK